MRREALKQNVTNTKGIVVSNPTNKNNGHGARKARSVFQHGISECIGHYLPVPPEVSKLLLQQPR
jgi:hypothetical protein